MPKAKLVTIFGGSGFLGRHIANHMAGSGWRVRVACRNPHLAGVVRTYGVVGQVEPVFCNIRDDDSVRAVTADADAVINCVGLMEERRKNTFDAVQTEGAGRIARLAREENVARMVHVSAIGADAESAVPYARTKAEGEALVRASFPEASIVRPSALFGAEDGFFNQLGSLSRVGPFMPVIGAETKLQPAYVDDVARACATLARGDAAPGLYELGGPDVATMRELTEMVLGMTHRKRLMVNMPFWVARIVAGVFGLISKVSLGLIGAPIIGDQVRLLKVDNVVSDGAKGFADLGIEPSAMDAILPEYLWRYRPQGQYDALMDSAKNLRRKQDA